MDIWLKLEMVNRQIENYNRLKNLSDEWFYNDNYIDIFGLKNKKVQLHEKIYNEGC